MTRWSEIVLSNCRILLAHHAEFCHYSFHAVTANPKYLSAEIATHAEGEQVPKPDGITITLE